MIFIIRDLSGKPYKSVETRGWALVLLKDKETRRKNGILLYLLYPFSK